MDIKKRSKWVYLIIALGVLLFYVLPAVIFGYFIYHDMKTPDISVLEDGSISVDNKKLVIQRGTTSKYSYAENTFYITGYLKNNDNSDIEGVEIEYEVYDKQGNILGVATAYLQTLKKGATWKFKAIYSDIDAKEVKSFKITKVDHI